VQVRELFDLTGRTALVTGGGRGIGRHIALGLAEAGADVFVASRKLGNCETVARAVEKLGRRSVAMRVDLGAPDQIERLVEDVLAQTPRLDILVNNAALLFGAPTLEYPLEAWDRVFAVNVRGLWRLSQLLARHMKDRGGGSIIHVGSYSGLRGATEEGMPAIAYNASKGAVVTLTKDMAVKLARYGIRVNSIAPGAFDTDMMEHLRRDPERLRRYLEGVPLRRTGGEDDIKGVAVFLASPASAYVTGQTLVVDGGTTSL
jgi:gluconate 5-dehydrogenase